MFILLASVLVLLASVFGLLTSVFVFVGFGVRILWLRCLLFDGFNVCFC